MDSSNEVSFNITEHIGVLNTRENGWNREINLVSWNGRPTKLDIRDWNQDKTRMTRGIGLTEVETEVLRLTLNDSFNEVISFDDVKYHLQSTYNKLVGIENKMERLFDNIRVDTEQELAIFKDLQRLKGELSTINRELQIENDLLKRDIESVSYEVSKHLAVIDTMLSGWNREVNLVSWNGKPTILDIRDWNQDKTKMTRGIGLTEAETEVLRDLLNERYRNKEQEWER